MEYQVLTLGNRQDRDRVKNIIYQQLNAGNRLMEILNYSATITNIYNEPYPINDTYEELYRKAWKYISDQEMPSIDELTKILYPSYSYNADEYGYVEDILDGQKNYDEYTNMAAAYSDVLKYLREFLQGYCYNDEYHEHRKNIALIVVRYKGLPAGLITTFTYKGLCYMIGIQQYAPYALARLWVHNGLDGPEFPRVSDKLVEAVQGHCKSEGTRFISVHPLERMRKILHMYHGFNQDPKMPEHVDVPKWIPYVTDNERYPQYIKRL